MKTFNERFCDYFEELGDCDQVNIYNEYASGTGHERIYGMEDFNEIMQGFEPISIARQVRFSDFNPNHDFFTFNGHGNLVSFERVHRWIEVDEVAEWYEDRYHVMSGLIGSVDCDYLYAIGEEDEDEQDDEE